MEKDNIKGCFVSSVLLSQNQWDKKQFIHDFEEDWGIVLLFLSPKRNTRNFADSMVVFLSRLTGYRPTKRNLPSATGAELSTIRSGRSGSAYRAAISKIRMKAPSSIMMRLQTTGTRLDAPDTLPMVSRISLMWKRK